MTALRTRSKCLNECATATHSALAQQEKLLPPPTVDTDDPNDPEGEGPPMFRAQMSSRGPFEKDRESRPVGARTPLTSQARWTKRSSTPTTTTKVLGNFRLTTRAHTHATCTQRRSLVSGASSSCASTHPYPCTSGARLQLLVCTHETQHDRPNKLLARAQCNDNNKNTLTYSYVDNTRSWWPSNRMIESILRSMLAF